MNEFDNKNDQFENDISNNIPTETPHTVEDKAQETVSAAPETDTPVNNAQPAQNQYQPYGDPYGYRPQGNPQGYGYVPYNYNQQGNPYGNPYVQQNPYGQGISYTPVQKKKKEKKQKSGISGGAVALICCATIILSGVFGFGGAYMADIYFTDGNAPVSSSTPEDQISFDSPVVIYRDVDNIQTSAGENGETLNYSQVAAIVKDSVVEITTEYNVQSVWYNYVTQGAGSGVIISENGYIITNAHVITGDSGAVADNIIVRLTNGQVYNAAVVGYDTDSDIAIIKIEETGLSAAVCGNSDNLAVGEELVVVGNPLGELGGTVTNGIVSATEREIDVNGVTMSLIQTNAAVSPGNSGGGMFNMKGELVGIINAKSSGTGVEGLGFAIPINESLRVTEQLMEYGYVRGKTFIGASFDEVTSSNSFYYFYGVKPGVYITYLEKGYNDEVLKQGDRVVAIDGATISTFDEIKSIVSKAEVGDKLTFQVEREGKLIEVEVTCYEKVPESAKENVQFEQ